jgi:hypothetical protein
VPRWVDDALEWSADPPELVEVRIAVALSDLHGRPGLRAVRAWPVDVLAEALLLTVAHDGMARYEERRRIAEDSLK